MKVGVVIVKNADGRPANSNYHRFELLRPNTTDPVNQWHIKDINTGKVVVLMDLDWENTLGHFIKELMNLKE